MRVRIVTPASRSKMPLRSNLLSARVLLRRTLTATLAIGRVLAAFDVSYRIK